VRLIDAYMAELAAALHVRGRSRRRVLEECRHHLADAAATRGEEEAVRAFGPAATIAAELDAESAARRMQRATAFAALGVVLTGASTLVLINAAQPGLTAPTAWAIVFFAAAQLSATAAALACLQALGQRRTVVAPAELALLGRRNLTALAGAGVTMFAAGAALPGRGSAVVLLAGPVVVCVAFIAVVRARRLTRRLRGSREGATRAPLDDLRRLLSTPLPPLPPAALLACSAPWRPRPRLRATSPSTRRRAGPRSPRASRPSPSSDALSPSAARSDSGALRAERRRRSGSRQLPVGNLAVPRTHQGSARRRMRGASGAARAQEFGRHVKHGRS
jgi:uncharacterized membrane protein